MTLRQKKILECLSKNPLGLKASEIADKLNVGRREINQFLYYEQTDYVNTGEPYYKWVKKTGNKSQSSYFSTVIKKEDPVLSKLNNRQGAKIFTSRQFNALADWSYCSSHRSKDEIKVYTTKTGNQIEYDSNLEFQMLEYLNNNKLVKEIGGQNFCIKYSSSYKDGKNYYPDFVALTNDGKVLIVEIKQAKMMSHHTNLEKYAWLSDFCESNGYMYMMVDPSSDFMTYEELYDMKVDTNLLEHFEKLVKKSKRRIICFDDDDVNNWYGNFGTGWNKEEFYLMVHSLIIYYNWHNKAAFGNFNVSSIPF